MDAEGYTEIVKKRVPARFSRPQRAICPACLDRGAVNLLGKPIFVRGMKLTGGCELCGGNGEVMLTTRTGDWPVGDAWVVRSPVPAA